MTSQEIVNLKENRSRIETALRNARSACNMLARDSKANAQALQAKHAEIVSLEADLKQAKKAVLQAELEAIG